MKLLIQWEEGNEVRTTEMEIDGMDYPTLLKGIKELVRKAYKWSGKKAPEGLLEEGEIL